MGTSLRRHANVIGNEPLTDAVNVAFAPGQTDTEAGLASANDGHAVSAVMPCTRSRWKLVPPTSVIRMRVKRWEANATGRS